MAYDVELLTAAHDASSNHEHVIGRSDVCGCFFCLKTFPPGAIAEWVEEPGGGRTAVCPHCRIDSVLGSASGFPLTQEFLEAMCEYWCGD
jgi:hypothetical protein